MRQIFFLLMLFGMAACTSQGLDEARAVVAQADSVRAAGRMYDDSLQLAKAYTVLGRHPRLHADEYAHACYHYGRLLREKEDPAAAMQCFIRATHSHTHDLHILGRVYSNMGDLCHLAKDYPLAYDMYKHSADKYVQNGDTLLYYYDLNNMAFELAEQGKKEEAFVLLNQIEEGYQNQYLLSKSLEIKALACLTSKEYDSAIYYIKKEYQTQYIEPTDLIICAQAYSRLGIKDSATYYAEKVYAVSNTLSDMNNALYILTNDDESKDKSAIRETAAKRADIHKLLEIRQGKMSQAVQLLEQDLHRKPNLKWLYAIIATWMVVGAVISIYVSRKHKRKELLTQEIDELQQTAYTIREKHDALAESYQRSHKQIEDDINNKCALLQTDEKIKQALAWKNYNRMCKVVDKQFYLFASKLQSKQTLNETEIRLCILTLLDCGYDQMAELLFRSSASIGTQKNACGKEVGNHIQAITAVSD